MYDINTITQISRKSSEKHIKQNIKSIFIYQISHEYYFNFEQTRDIF